MYTGPSNETVAFEKLVEQQKPGDQTKIQVSQELYDQKKILGSTDPASTVD